MYIYTRLKKQKKGFCRAAFYAAVKNAIIISLFFLVALPIFSQISEKKPSVVTKAKETDETPEKEPQTAEEYYNSAQQLWRKSFANETVDQTLDRLNKAIALKFDYAEAFYFRGFVHNRIGQYQAAVNDLDVVLRLNSRNSAAYGLRAETKVKLKDFKGALADYDSALLIRPTIGLMKGLGRLKYFLGDYDEAIQDFTRIANSPNAPSEVYFWRGATYIKKGDKVSALKDFQKICESLDYVLGDSVKKYPEMYSEPEGYPFGSNPLADPSKNSTSSMVSGVAVSVVNASKGDSKLVGLKFPSFEEKLVLNNWFDLNSDRYYDLTLFNEESGIVYYHYGLLLKEQNLSKEAEEAFTKAISYDYEGRKNFDAWFQRGKIRLNEKKFESAVRDFSWAISLKPAFPDSYLERGAAILMLGRDEIAQKDFEKFTALNPSGKNILKSRIAQGKKLRAEINKR